MSNMHSVGRQAITPINLCPARKLPPNCAQASCLHAGANDENVLSSRFHRGRKLRNNPSPVPSIRSRRG